MPNRKLAILGFHRVLAVKDDIETYPDSAEFESIVRMLNRVFNILPLREGVARLKQGSLPSRALVLTFDDGYLDNLTVALPILERFKLPATCFVATGFLGGDCMWNDKIIDAVRNFQGQKLDLRKADLPTYDVASTEQKMVAIGQILKQLKYMPYDDRADSVDKIRECVQANPVPKLMMNTDEVRRLHGAGVEIGAHTVTHPILSRLSPDRADVEILTSKSDLEEILGDRVVSFAYPNGRPEQDYNQHHVDAVKRGEFELAVSTHWGCASRDTDRFQLPRMAVYGKSMIKAALRLLRSYYQ